MKQSNLEGNGAGVTIAKVQNIPELEGFETKVVPVSNIGITHKMTFLKVRKIWLRPHEGFGFHVWTCK
jgi:hypothetical protein